MSARLRATRTPRGDGTYDVTLFIEGGEQSGQLVAYVPYENVPSLMNDMRLAMTGQELYGGSSDGPGPDS